MAGNSNEVEQVVARTLRDSLAKLQQTTVELNQAISDLVSACASARPANSLPPMLRARSAAASLAASLEVLSKFVMSALQSAPPAQAEVLATLPRAAVPAPPPLREIAPDPPAVVETASRVAEAVAEPVAEPVADPVGEPLESDVAPVAAHAPEPALLQPVAPVTPEVEAPEPKIHDEIPVAVSAEAAVDPVVVAPEVAVAPEAVASPGIAPMPKADVASETAMTSEVALAPEVVEALEVVVTPEIEKVPEVAAVGPEVAAVAPEAQTEFPIAADPAAPEAPELPAPGPEPIFEPTVYESPAAELTRREPVAEHSEGNGEGEPLTAELYELATWKEPAPKAEPEAEPGLAPDLPEAAFDLPKNGEEVPEPVAAAPEADSEVPVAASIFLNAELPPEAKGFDVSSLSPDQQELHRRANRVAKVSMQDVKMLRPRDLALGREHKDICTRLRDDIEKAHKEYDRRFHAILDHPVDYFYDWMVEILGDGDPETLGDYPYPSPVLRR